MSRASIRDFSGGWWAMGPKDNNPSTTLRRAKGISSLKTKSALSRWGSTQLYNLDAHSLFRFANFRFQGAGKEFYRDGISIKGGLTGERLSFVRMAPSPGDPDSLFCAGGGALFKVDQVGHVTGWGIDPPPDGFTATVTPANSRIVDGFEDQSTWTGVNVTLADEATIKQVDTRSTRVTVTGANVGTVTKAIAIDLTHFTDGSNSPDEDFITLWVRVDNPSNLVGLELCFDVGAGDFASDYYKFAVAVTDKIPPSTQLVEQTVGIGTIPGTETVLVDNYDTGVPDRITRDILIDLGQTKITTAIGTWVRLRIPKASFSRVGKSSANFGNVQAVQIVVRTTGSVIVYLDNLELIGSAGLQGNYKYRLTYLNSTTGSRSNANLTPVLAEKVMRSAVALSNLPVPADTQVDKIEIWRTVGNGVLYFKIDEVNAGTLVYTDRVADFSGLDSSPGAKLMQNIQLPIDNIRLDQTIGYIYGPFQGCMFACGNTVEGSRGRVYYSPIGRPEGLANFLQVTSDDDQTQCVIAWNGSMWAFSKAHLYQIQGNGNVFTYTEVVGVIGTIAPFSIEATPAGIFYQATDGLRVFNGITSSLIGEAQLGALDRGESLEGVEPFKGLDAAYGHNQYLVTDAIGETLAYNFTDATWRYFGVGFRTMFYEPDTGLVIATLNGKVVILEDNLVENDNGAPIPFEVEIPSVASSVEHAGLFQRLYIKMNTQGQLLTPTIIIDGDEFQIPAIQTPSLPGRTGGTIEIPVMRNGLSMGVRLTGALTKRVEIVEVAADLYLSGGIVLAEQQLHGMQQVMKAET